MQVIVLSVPLIYMAAVVVSSTSTTGEMAWP